MTQWVEGVFYNVSTIVYKYICRNLKNNQTCILFSLIKHSRPSEGGTTAESAHMIFFQ
ncbi:MAG: hypothetical protein ACI9U0_002518, partial [Flavobacteriales bacterium]